MEANRINIAAGMPRELIEESEFAKKAQKPRKIRTIQQITLQTVIDFINNKDYSSNLKEYLVKIARSRPNGTLEHFMKNINVYANKFRKNGA